MANRVTIFPESYEHSFSNSKDDRLLPILRQISDQFEEPHQTLGFNFISSRFALPSLQRVLRETFGRAVSSYDEHGIRLFSVARNVLDLEETELVSFVEGSEDDDAIVNSLVFPATRFRKQAKTFRVFYLEGLVTPSEILSHFDPCLSVENRSSRKSEMRSWEKMFSKHFYVSTSQIDILYDAEGFPLKLDDDDDSARHHSIHLLSAVGFDVSAHRLTGVHFGDLLRLLERNDGKSIQTKRYPTSRIPLLWVHAYDDWDSLGVSPKELYSLRSDVLLHDYRLQFGLAFEALRCCGVEVPIVSAIGCGVFGKAFSPDYQKTVIQAYCEVLSESDYGFAAVVLCDVRQANLEIFSSFLREESIVGRLKIPLVLCNGDMLIVARFLSRFYETSVMNAGDLWEFGGFFESGSALEEFITRMTTAYLSQHPQMNPEVMDAQNYVGISTDCVGLSVGSPSFRELQDFVRAPVQS